MAAPQAPLTRPPGSGSWAGGARKRTGAGGFGAGVGLSCRGPGDLLHDGTGGGEGNSQAYLGPRARTAPGDMMIDRASSRLRGMRPLSLYRPSAWPCAAGPVAADSGLAGASRGYAHLVSSAPPARRP